MRRLAPAQLRKRGERAEGRAGLSKMRRLAPAQPRKRGERAEGRAGTFTPIAEKNLPFRRPSSQDNTIESRT